MTTTCTVRIVVVVVGLLLLFVSVIDEVALISLVAVFLIACTVCSVDIALIVE